MNNFPTVNLPPQPQYQQVAPQQPVSALSAIGPTKHQSPPRIVLHGPEKVGKSTFFVGAPNPIFIPTEDGLTGIEANAFPLCQSYNDIINCLSALCNEQHDYKTLVLDSADWAETLIHKHVCGIQNVANIEKASGGYGKGYLDALNLWQNIVKALDYINKQKGMIIGIICHSRVVSINDPLNEVYDSYQMKLHSPKSGNGSSELLREWADILLFADTEKFTRKIDADGSKDDKRSRATGTGRRLLYTSPSPAYAAGNRYNLPPQLNLDWMDLQSALTGTATNNTQKV